MVESQRWCGGNRAALQNLSTHPPPRFRFQSETQINACTKPRMIDLSSPHPCISHFNSAPQKPKDPPKTRYNPARNHNQTHPISNSFVLPPASTSVYDPTHHLRCQSTLPALNLPRHSSRPLPPTHTCGSLCNATTDVRFARLLHLALALYLCHSGKVTLPHHTTSITTSARSRLSVKADAKDATCIRVPRRS